jgi:DNA-binding HxlR family transcriptional regulator
MSTAYASRRSVAHVDRDAAASVGEVLRLLSAGAPGEILLALRDGPMQTKVLTHQVKGYTARTIYRYLPKLAELGLLERDDQPGGPARVVHTLDGGGGDELSALFDRFATASMTRLPGGQIDSREWAALGLLADLWKAGVIAALSRGATSPTELTRGLGVLSYHQLNRRASRFKASGFLCASRQSRRQRRCYALTRKARRTMGLIAGIGRWRRRYLAGEGLTVAEAATVLRVSLPLARVPDLSGAVIQLGIADESGGAHLDLWVEVAEDGAVHLRESPGSRPDGWAEGTVDDWMAALIDGRTPVHVGVAGDCLIDLYERLWTPRPF